MTEERMAKLFDEEENNKNRFYMEKKNIKFHKLLRNNIDLDLGEERF